EAMSAIMIQGTSSWAGKSFLTTALCRLFARRGVRVAPFKAQNMSNNARVADGGEIGAAQYLQALAAGVVPDVRMNPVLVKPEGDGRAQVVINGSADHELSRIPWPERQRQLWPVIATALRSLRDEFELLVIEGAGSPAEINLRSFDLVNMRIAKEADAPVLLVADIHRGGAFAHLYGTWALLDEEERARIRGFVLNKFRGDPALLPARPNNAPGADQGTRHRRDALAPARPARRRRRRATRPESSAAAGRRRSLSDRIQSRRVPAARAGRPSRLGPDTGGTRRRCTRHPAGLQARRQGSRLAPT